jgi:cysteine synthase
MILITPTGDKRSGNPHGFPGKLGSVTLMAATAPATTPAIADRLRALERLIGNTPLLAIDYEMRGRKRTIYAKSEQMNLTGSIKDRMALHIIRKAYAEGRLHIGDTIVEATSGNTGIAFAALGRALGHPVTIFMPNWMSRERMDLIHSLGANIIPVTKQQGGFLGSIRMSEELAAERADVFLPRQFSNTANVEAHAQTTGPELYLQLKSEGLIADAFVAGVGTGGTVMGVGRYLKQQNPATRVYPMEPRESPTLSTGCKVGQHRIQGISDEFVPAILQLCDLNPVIEVSDGDSILMAQKLAAELGLAVGISSGANFLAAAEVQDDLGDDAIVATVFADDNKKYLSTDLLRDEPVKSRYRTPEITLMSFRTVKRVCNVCCDADGCDQKVMVE